MLMKKLSGIQYGSGGYRETIEKVRGIQNPKKQE